MLRVLDPFRFVLIAVAGWMNQHRLQVIDYLHEENRVLREQRGGRRVRLNDDQRRRLAAKAKALGRKLLAEVATEFGCTDKPCLCDPLAFRDGIAVFDVDRCSVHTYRVGAQFNKIIPIQVGDKNLAGSGEYGEPINFYQPVHRHSNLMISAV